MRNEAGEPGRSFDALVGPAGPEVGCEECFDRLDAYVELEITGADAAAAMPAMRAHLQGCSACRDDYESLRALLRAGPH